MRQPHERKGLLPSYRITPRDYPGSWTNQGRDVEVTITPESFRPYAPWTSDQDDCVLLARDPGASSVTVTWVLTEDGNDEVTGGVLEAHAADLVDAADLFNSTFFEGN